MKCGKEELLLYAVTDSRWLRGEKLAGQVEKAVRGGATFVQIREKEMDINLQNLHKIGSNQQFC